jgi:hypothetical protein
MTPVGYGAGETPAKVALARERFDTLSALLCLEPGHQAAWTVLEWLEADAHPNYAEEYDLPKAEAQRRAVSRIRRVADALIGHLK